MTMSAKLEQRSPAMDVVRCFALFLVISVHFLAHTGYYGTIMEGPRMFAVTVIRSLFMICVPLFMILSGYLMSGKKPTKAYYSKLIYTVVVYIFASLCCVLYKIFFMHQELSVMEIVRGIFNYTAAQYAWYVEMYIGLFLLCPFLNVLYNNLKSQKEKKLLLLTMLILTALPKVINGFVPELQWFLNPASSRDYMQVLPNFWVQIYPITYYFIGCYLREYKLRLRPRTLALLSVVLMVLNGMYVYYRCHGVNFIWGAWQDYGSLLIVAQAVLCFAFFDNLRFEKFPRIAAKAFRSLSGLCFVAYLVSWIFDSAFYPLLRELQPDVHLRFNYYPIIVPLVYVCSLLLSFVINKLYAFFAFVFAKVFSANKEPH